MADKEITDAAPDQPLPLAIVEIPQMPALHDDGSCWTEAETDQAVLAYLYAIDAGNPDAGRMRTVIVLHKHPLKDIGERIKI